MQSPQRGRGRRGGRSESRLAPTRGAVAGFNGRWRLARGLSSQSSPHGDLCVTGVLTAKVADFDNPWWLRGGPSSQSSPHGDLCVTRRAGFSKVARPRLPPPSLSLPQRGRGLSECHPRSPRQDPNRFCKGLRGEKRQDLPAPPIACPRAVVQRSPEGERAEGGGLRWALARRWPPPARLQRAWGVCLLSVSPRGDFCVTRRAGFSKVARPPPPPALSQSPPEGERFK